MEGTWEINTSGRKCKLKGVNDERLGKQFTVMNLTSRGMNNRVWFFFPPEKVTLVFILENWNYRFVSKVCFLTNPVICLFISVINALLFSHRNDFFKVLRPLSKVNVASLVWWLCFCPCLARWLSPPHVPSSQMCLPPPRALLCHPQVVRVLWH